MTLATIPDVDHIIGNHLATHPDIVAITGARRVVNKTPNSTDAPWVRLTMLSASSRHRLEHLIESYFQFDCYSSKAGLNGSQQADAARLALAVRAAVMDMENASLSGLTVTGAEIRGHARVPDSVVGEPARERYVLSAVVWCHA